MDYMWAPWRMTYLEQHRPEGCILCQKPKETTDAENYIIYRGKTSFVILNSFPYNPGHLMVAPYRHVANLEDLTTEELADLMGTVTRGIKVLREAFHPAGFNVGVNIGRAAGAGIDDHCHAHIVPRWNGDTNFMPVVSGVKVINQALADTYNALKGKF